ncbi:MAG: hypothetical protein JXR76_12300 [Deltaproteobacteria bacterium]|nr:hypothetical protein [Deltaproteobacteria bacterium]
MADPYCHLGRSRTMILALVFLFRRIFSIVKEINSVTTKDGRIQDRIDTHHYTFEWQ